MATQSQRVKFRKGVDIGSIAAESDRFLETCFLDTGHIADLKDPKDPKRVILGRTGTGKTAIINEMQKQNWSIINIDPEALSLQYLSNSTILQYLNQIGVHLDLFYKLLWKHIFAVELLKRHYKLEDEDSQRRFLDSLFSRLGKNKRKRQAVQYLVDWSDSFFEDTEYRVKQITEKLENKVSAEAGIDFKQVSLAANSEKSTSLEQKSDIVKKAQNAVNSIQIVELNDILNLMASDIFIDPQKNYFVVIDDLDKDWVDQSIVYSLIKALLETIQDFSHTISNVKIVIALRENILDKILRSQGKRGPQREKYEPLYMQLFWGHEELTEIVDLRINQLFRGQYTSNNKVTHKDILPGKSKHRPDGISYILQRTFNRPRDVIHFLNICIKNSVDKTTISWESIRSAEQEYSSSRLDSLFDEWKENYPYLDKVFDLFEGFEPTFSIFDISDELLLGLIDELYFSKNGSANTNNWLGEIAQSYIDSGESSFQAARFKLVNVLYKVGFLGVKEDNSTKVKYSFYPSGNLKHDELYEDMRVWIHPAFHQALKIRTKS